MCHRIRYRLLSLTLLLLPLLVGGTTVNQTVPPCAQDETPIGCVQITLKPSAVTGDFYVDSVLTVSAQNPGWLILTPDIEHTIEVKNVQSTEQNFGTLFSYPGTSTTIKVKAGEAKKRTIQLTKNYIRGTLKFTCEIKNAAPADMVACRVAIDYVVQPDVNAGQSASYILDPGNRLISVSAVGDQSSLFDPASKGQTVKIVAGKKIANLRVTFTKKGHLFLDLNQTGVVADFYLDGAQIATQVAAHDLWVASKVNHNVETRNVTDPAAAGVYTWQDTSRKVSINSGADKTVTFKLKKQYIKGFLLIECNIVSAPGTYCVPTVNGTEMAAIATGASSQYSFEPGSYGVVVTPGPDGSWEPASTSRTVTIQAGKTQTVSATFVAVQLTPAYAWLSQQQDGVTGLVASQQDRFASTYNNALAVMAFTLKSDYGKAKKILDFFNGKANEFFDDNACESFALPCSQNHLCGSNEPCGFFQYRDSTTGIPSQNVNRWMGDNAWLLMAIHYYQTQTGDTSYEAMANSIVHFLETLQQSEGYIAPGWENGDNTFNSNGHAEGNLDAYKALLLYDETLVSHEVKHWLDYHDLAWKTGPLDLHSWRVLSLGKEYGYNLLDTELTDDPASRYKSTISYNASSVSGFLPHPAYCQENIWSEGTGGMAIGFYKAGYEERGDFYVGQLEKLLFEPQSYLGTQALSFFALVSPCDTWADPTAGHVASTSWYIFAKEHFDPFDGVVMTSFETANPLAQIEGENYKVTSLVGVRFDNRGELFEGKAIHIGGDNNISNDNSGWAEYQFNILVPLTITTVNIRYADDVGGDAGVMLLDGNPIASFNTVDTGTWDDYVVTNLPVDSIQIQPGLHTLKFEVTDNGTYGLTVDYFQVTLP